MEFGPKKLWNWFIWFHKFFWPGLFLIFLAHCEAWRIKEFEKILLCRYSNTRYMGIVLPDDTSELFSNKTLRRSDTPFRLPLVTIIIFTFGRQVVPHAAQEMDILPILRSKIIWGLWVGGKKVYIFRAKGWGKDPGKLCQ